MPIWQDINPGLFYFFSKLIIETTNKFELIIIFNIVLQFFGVLLFYKNIKKLISKDVALISTFLIIITPFFIFYSGTIHETNLSFFFLNLFIYFFLKFKNNLTLIQTFFLILLIIFACSNYWVNFVFIQIFLFYYYIYEQRLNIKFLPLALSPLILFVLFLFILTILHSSPDIFIEKMLGRTLDLRMGTNFGDLDKVLNLNNIILYPAYLDHRIRTMLNFGLVELLILLVFFKLNKIEIKKKRILLVLMICSLTWFIIFPQHTIIHRFSGKYAYFGCIVLFSTLLISFFSNYKKINNVYFKAILILVIISFLYNFTNKSYLFVKNVYLSNKLVNTEINYICKRAIKKDLKSSEIIENLKNSKLNNNFNFDYYRLLKTEKSCKG